MKHLTGWQLYHFVIWIKSFFIINKKITDLIRLNLQNNPTPSTMYRVVITYLLHLLLNILHRLRNRRISDLNSFKKRMTNTLLSSIL